ncbi:hypothetical protein Tco_1561353 [Tanacetum coccineum]
MRAKKESSDEECLTSGSEDEEYAMAVKRLQEWALDADIQINLIGECPSTRDKNQRDLLEVLLELDSGSDSGEENDERLP